MWVVGLDEDAIDLVDRIPDMPIRDGHAVADFVVCAYLTSVKSSCTIQRLGLGGDKIICLPPKAAIYSILYCMHGQRDEKGIMSTPKRKKHHIDYTHIKKK